MTAYYPSADHDTQWFADDYPGDEITPNCVVLHTTETGSWPAYDGGSVAPTLTIRANEGTEEFSIRQHFPLDMSSRALVNEPGGVETNTLNCIQIELVGSCTREDGYGAIYWPQAPDWCLDRLGGVLATLHQRYPAIRLEAPDLWLPYPQSYGQTKARMTRGEWENFYGICGHEHVPENDHGDPGDLHINRILDAANEHDGAAPEARKQSAKTSADEPAPQPAAEAEQAGATGWWARLGRSIRDFG